MIGDRIDSGKAIESVNVEELKQLLSLINEIVIKLIPSGRTNDNNHEKITNNKSKDKDD